MIPILISDDDGGVRVKRPLFIVDAHGANLTVFK
jgi:hypothetical protein